MSDYYQNEEVFFPGVQKCIINIMPGAVEILTLVIEDTNRGKGIGSQVLDNLKKRFPDRFLMVLPVATQDPSRQLDVERFYRKNGFVWDTGYRGVQLESMSYAPYRKRHPRR